ncbi:LysR family transcriptional regulator [Roseovarius pelagicus]|uniref:LysR family transcriptional regulator n=1 Tax=Roseovarius pelagicus TaxID=2980108 RepID=A0ABY6DAM9_9RHOB|nr:LysR family transcriptional regulator [Roseovarius pelagicus]UXX83167.1 LysR family transcriptional regulator [Roseovarius pelagicus]
MTFDQIRSFYLVAVLGTYAKAAEHLNATQPTISARIVALEGRLGVKLFDRSGHRVALTPEGRSFLRSAEKLLDIQADVFRRFDKPGIRGIVRIGASDTMAVTWIPSFIAELRAANPNAEFELHIGPSYRLHEELLARKIDIAFIVGPIASPELISHPLCRCPLVFTAAPSLGLHLRRIVSADIEKMDIFTFERMTRPHQELVRVLRTKNLSPRIHPVNSLQTVVLMVKKGLGVGVVPFGAVEEDVADGNLAVLNTDFSLSDTPFIICYPSGPDSHAVETLAQHVKEFLKARGSSDSIRIID